jgi:hypothetical protein
VLEAEDTVSRTFRSLLWVVALAYEWMMYHPLRRAIVLFDALHLSRNEVFEIVSEEPMQKVYLNLPNRIELGLDLWLSWQQLGSSVQLLKFKECQKMGRRR